MSSLMKKGLLFGLVAAFILSGSAVFAGEVASSDDKVSVSLYGQVNRAITTVSDGEETYRSHVDNDNSSTRFGFKAKAKGSDALTIGANLEWEYQSNASNSVTHDDTTIDAGLSRRKLEVFLDFAGIGKFTLGHGPTASDGTSQVDLSGTKVAGYSLITAWAGSYEFFDNDADAHSGISVSDVMNELDGNSRKDRFQYDSPKFSGFQIAASTFEVETFDDGATIEDKHEPAYDIALKYSGMVKDSVKLAGAVAYSNYPSTDDANAADKMINGSLSALFSGISITLAVGQRELDNVADSDPDSEKFYFVKLGYMADFWDVGSTAFAFDYGKFDDYNNTSDNEAKTYAIYAVQKLENWGTELYAGYRIHKLDAPGESYEDIGALFLGTRIKF